MRADFVAKAGDVKAVEAVSGKCGAFIRTFDKPEERKPVVITEEKKLGDLLISTKNSTSRFTAASSLQEEDGQ